MTGAEVIRKAANHGCVFVLQGDRMILKGPPDKVAEVAKVAKPFKEEIVESLRSAERGDRPPAPPRPDGSTELQFFVMACLKKPDTLMTIIDGFPVGVRRLAIKLLSMPHAWEGHVDHAKWCKLANQLRDSLAFPDPVYPASDVFPELRKEQAS